MPEGNNRVGENGIIMSTNIARFSALDSNRGEFPGKNYLSGLAKIHVRVYPFKSKRSISLLRD